MWTTIDYTLSDFILQEDLLRIFTCVINVEVWNVVNHNKNTKINILTSYRLLLCVKGILLKLINLINQFAEIISSIYLNILNMTSFYIKILINSYCITTRTKVIFQFINALSTWSYKVEIQFLAQCWVFFNDYSWNKFKVIKYLKVNNLYITNSHVSHENMHLVFVNNTLVWSKLVFKSIF